jgi:putative (di)nucleoside polyphosphate hydrolase
MVSKPLRAGVVGVFINDDGQVLQCERSNQPGSWQFPQGGIDDGETPLQAVLREIREELGTTAFEVVRTSLAQTVYFFPEGVRFPIAKDFSGQSHQWFLLRFLPGALPDLAASDGEFRAYRWTSVALAIDTVVEWKRGSYREGISHLGIGG